MLRDGSRAQTENRPNLPVRLALRDPTQDLSFAPAQAERLESCTISRTRPLLLQKKDMPIVITPANRKTTSVAVHDVRSHAQRNVGRGRERLLMTLEPLSRRVGKAAKTPRLRAEVSVKVPARSFAYEDGPRTLIDEDEAVRTSLDGTPQLPEEHGVPVSLSEMRPDEIQDEAISLGEAAATPMHRDRDLQRSARRQPHDHLAVDTRRPETLVIDRRALPLGRRHHVRQLSRAAIASSAIGPCERVLMQIVTKGLKDRGRPGAGLVHSARAVSVRQPVRSA